MEVADLPGNRTKKRRLISFREQGCVGAAPKPRAENIHRRRLMLANSSASRVSTSVSSITSRNLALYFLLNEILLFSSSNQNDSALNPQLAVGKPSVFLVGESSRLQYWLTPACMVLGRWDLCKDGVQGLVLCPLPKCSVAISFLSDSLTFPLVPK